jgi:hypothetical protein
MFSHSTKVGADHPDWLKSKEVAQFFNSGWLTFFKGEPLSS